MRPIKASLASFSVFATLITASGADNPFIGDWALTIPGGAAGWLGVDEAAGQLKASMLWGWGSVFQLDAAKMDGANLVLTRNQTVERRGADGKRVRQRITEVITCTADGDAIQLTSVKPRDNGQGE